MKFVAIDFETANPCLSSVCQIGTVTFENETPVDKWKSLVNPDDYFDLFNVSIHGIEEHHVQDAPRFPDVFEHLAKMLLGQIVVHHTGFDKVAFARASEKHGLPAVECSWLDSAKVVRRTWPELSRRGYGLSPVAEMLGIQFRHHDAQEDARAAGEILLGAIRHSGMPLSDWLSRVNRSISGTSSGTHEDHRRIGNPEGQLAGATIVFTGALLMARREAADLAAEAGCDVGDGVTKTTTILVVGDQDIRKLVGHEKSAKHRKAETLMAKGQQIRILGETDFLRMVRKEEMV